MENNILTPDFIDDYASARVDSAQLDTLINIILSSSRLDYDGESLVLEADRPVFEFIKALRPIRYDQRLDGLIEAKERKDKERKDAEKTKEKK